MKIIETKKVINKRIDEVWNKLMDFKNYPRWNKFIIQISGEPKVGKYIKARLKNGNKEILFKPKVLVNNTNREFRWKGKLFINGIFDGEHYFKLKKISDNKTELIHGEIFTGFLSGFIFKLIEKETRAGFNLMNENI